MTTRVKICGLTREADIEAAAFAGADYLGLVFASGPRALSVPRAEVLSLHAREIGFTGGLVGVLVDAPLEDLAELAGRCDLDVLQLHGGESPAYVSSARRVRPVWKAISVGISWEAHELSAAAAPYEEADAILLDGAGAGRGGTGRRFPHGIARALARSRPIVIAGGLTPGNVSQVVRDLHPFAVDVSSGVEREPGVKRADAIEAFVGAVFSSDREQHGSTA
jgi:phosphoribosylanthranilate isomerase